MPRSGGQIAAIDLGSNSFHLVVATARDGQLRVIDRHKEMVQLGAGLGADQRIDRPTQRRALACLRRFGQRLRDVKPGRVRAVGTNTLRVARNGPDFLAEAEAALGHPIEVIAGPEEARLIYLGVAHSTPPSRHRRLVIDIGGGSTEAIIGSGFETLARDSLFMGCISMTRRHFPKGRITERALHEAELAAGLEWQTIEAPYRKLGWRHALGASGTMLSLANLMRDEGWSDGGITRDGLRRLRAALVAAGSTDALKFKGLPRERAVILAGGFVIVQAAFARLKLARLDPAPGALREGLLHDLLGRMEDGDVRDRSVAALASRSGVDEAQAKRVARVAERLLDAVSAAWKLDPRRDAQLLRWAARLHEAGLMVAHNQYHKHGAYLIAHGDLPGFSRQEQSLLATLVRGHRRKFPVAAFAALPEAQRPRAERLCMLLRLAVLLHRGRHDLRWPKLRIKAGPRGLTLRFPGKWLERHPLSALDLQQEAGYLAAAGLRLRVS